VLAQLSLVHVSCCVFESCRFIEILAAKRLSC